MIQISKVYISVTYPIFAFNSLTPMVGHQVWHLACRRYSSNSLQKNLWRSYGTTG